MEKLDKKNPEGYIDMTAYLAIQKEEKMGNTVYAGDIVVLGSKDGVDRRYVVVQPHDNFSTALQIVEVTDASFGIRTKSGMMATNPQMLQYIYNNIISFENSLTDSEYAKLLNAVVEELGYQVEDTKVVEKIVEKPVNNDSGLAKAEAERDVYKKLYDELLDKMIRR